MAANNNSGFVDSAVNEAISKQHKQIHCIIQGMKRDISISVCDPNYAYENMNIRLTARNKETLLSATNEKGTLKYDLGASLIGVVLGYCAINNRVTVFTTDISNNTDYIYVIKYDSSNTATPFTLDTLWDGTTQGSLGFNALYPIETLGLYEDDAIQKVYWTDGLNQPRMINIVASSVVRSKWNSDSFNFLQSVSLKEKITITKGYIASGNFAPGVIQYAFTYCNKYAQETNIVYISPLYYLSHVNRGAAADTKVGNSFTIDIKGLDSKFDYIRIYSIQRTSQNTTPITKLVTSLTIPSTVTSDTSLTFTDDGTTGSSVDSTFLLYVGGEDITAGTLVQKDNTLFLGNLTVKRQLIDEQGSSTIKDYFDASKSGRNVSFTYDTSIKSLNLADPIGLYPYTNQLSQPSRKIKTFKYLEYYRFGLQFQDKNGKWSEPIFIGDYQNTNCPPKSNTDSIDSQTEELAIAQYTIPTSAGPVIKSLIDKGYKRVRPIIVYPSVSDRECVCQGILCPTVFNIGDRADNSPFVQSSWFARPTDPSVLSSFSPLGVYSKDGDILEFRHLSPIPQNTTRNAEIQCIYQMPDSFINTDSTKDADYIGENRQNFQVDQSIFTMHSPEVEFADNLLNLDSSSLRLRIIGYVPITSGVNDIDIQTSTTQNVFFNTTKITPGFYKETLSHTGVSVASDAYLSSRTFISQPYWFDDISERISGWNTPTLTGFAVYPWQRTGSLNNFGGNKEGETASSVLKYKKMSYLRFSYNTKYLSTPWNSYEEGSNTRTGISGAVAFSSDEVTMIKIPAPAYSSLNDIVYYGNIDKLIANTNSYTLSGTNYQGYPIVVTPPILKADANDLPVWKSHQVFTDLYVPLSTYRGTMKTSDYAATSPVSMKYKSTPHIVMALNYTKDNIPRTLPVLGALTNYEPSKVEGRHFWDKRTNNLNSVLQETMTSVTTPSQGYLLLGELYNPNVSNRFNGTSESAKEINQWMPCGETQDLPAVTTDTSGNYILANDLTLNYLEGDTFYQRYDCLKTYPFTMQDENSITDIVSFMCETHINIDGRTDRNRGQVSNLTMNPTNFNLFNTVYNQQDNYFTYNSINHDMLTLSNFPNQVTWTLEKSLGEFVDKWTNVTLSSVIDLDGDKGSVNALKVFNNEIYCFQDKGLSNLLFNSRVLVSSSDGVPIQISNGTKMNGKQYKSNTIGCGNKWSIVVTPKGIYFMDNITTAIYYYSGTGSEIPQSLSDNLGFRQWFGENNTTEKYDSVNFNNFIGFYDKANGDIYFVNKDYCLCYSELLGQFTSFMSYEQTPAMFNIEDKFMAIKNHSLWELEAGDYNSFFGEYQPYYITFRVNPNIESDKVFNNIEYRADWWKDNKLTKANFDILTTWNEYQWGQSLLYNTIGTPSTLKDKFRVWRANIPRDRHNVMDRMRNPWIYLRLTKNNPNTLRMEFHDLIVKYFE